MIEIHYQRTFDDYQEAVAAQRSKSLRLKIVGVVIAALLYLVGVVVLMSFGASQGLAVLVTAIGFPLFAKSVSYAYGIWLRRDFRRHPSIALPEKTRIDDAGLHINSEVAGGTTKWVAYNGFKETQNLFLLYLGPRMAHVLPKRAFSSEQLEEFRRFADVNLPQSELKRSERIEHVASL